MVILSEEVTRLFGGSRERRKFGRRFQTKLGFEEDLRTVGVTREGRDFRTSVYVFKDPDMENKRVHKLYIDLP